MTPDPLDRIYSLLDAASVHDAEGVDDVLHNTPGVRLGLRGLVDGPDPFSPDEVYEAVLATVSRNVHPNSLVGYWSFDEGNGSIANDNSGFGNSGVLVNTPTWITGLSGTR